MSTTVPITLTPLPSARESSGVLRPLATLALAAFAIGFAGNLVLGRADQPASPPATPAAVASPAVAEPAADSEDAFAAIDDRNPPKRL